MSKCKHNWLDSANPAFEYECIKCGAQTNDDDLVELAELDFEDYEYTGSTRGDEFGDR
jgi:hypothetical protein